MTNSRTTSKSHNVQEGTYSERTHGGIFKHVDTRNTSNTEEQSSLGSEDRAKSHREAHVDETPLTEWFPLL